MRVLTLLIVLAAGAAEAKDCKLPELKDKELKGVIDFSKCIQARVRVLEEENTALRKELEDLGARLADFPGEIVNTNGRETRIGGGRLTRASYAMASRMGQTATYLAIDDKVVGDLCALGCAVTLQLTPDAAPGGTATGPSAVGPCTLHYTATTGAWTFTGCGDPVLGVDGNGKATGEGGGETIVSLGGACVLADAEPLRNVEAGAQPTPGSLNRDRGKSLFLIADADAEPTGPDRFLCELKLAR